MSNPAWDPMRELLAVQDRMNRLFESALTRTNFDPLGGSGSWAPVADVWETRDAFVFALEIPGLAMDQMDVRVDGDALVVEGERRMERERPGEHSRREVADQWRQAKTDCDQPENEGENDAGDDGGDERRLVRHPASLVVDGTAVGNAFPSCYPSGSFFGKRAALQADDVMASSFPAQAIGAVTSRASFP